MWIYSSQGALFTLQPHFGDWCNHIYCSSRSFPDLNQDILCPPLALENLNNNFPDIISLLHLSVVLLLSLPGYFTCSDIIQENNRWQLHPSGCYPLGLQNRSLFSNNFLPFRLKVAEPTAVL